MSIIIMFHKIYSHKIIQCCMSYEINEYLDMSEEVYFILARYLGFYICGGVQSISVLLQTQSPQIR